VALFSLKQKIERNVSVEVEIPTDDFFTLEVDRIYLKLRDMSPYYTKVRRTWMKHVRGRFTRKGNWEGQPHPWPALSLKSTVPLRADGITRMGPPKTMGGKPIRTLRSAMNDYMDLWLKKEHTGHKEKAQVDASDRGGAFLRINLRSNKIAHESGIKSMGGAYGFAGKKLPPRPVGWIEGDEVMLQRFLEFFDQHVWSRVEKPRIQGRLQKFSPFKGGKGIRGIDV
jgi:hypothetical protein